MYLIFVGCLVVFGWEFNIYLKVVVFTFYPTLVVFVMSWVRSAYLKRLIIICNQVQKVEALEGQVWEVEALQIEALQVKALEV